MSKRFGRTVISRPAADAYSYEAHCVGSDYAPLSGDCERPVVIQFTGLADKKLSRLKQWETDMSVDFAQGYGLIGRFRDDERVQHVDVEVRCRKCPTCMRARAAHWRMRAEAEIADASRTWFGTLTLAPEKLFWIESLAATNLLRRGTKWEHLTEPERFSETCRVLTKQFQLYMKRLRKSASGLRFVAVFEKHKSGAPHMHLLIHERDQPVRHAALSSKWELGFVKFNLVDEADAQKAARYVSKYLTKQAFHRILASRRYGKGQVSSTG